jgi:hypothetical protein
MDLARWLVGGGVVTAVIALIRTLLIAIIALWSLKANGSGRAHALALLKALRISLPFRDRDLS